MARRALLLALLAGAAIANAAPPVELGTLFHTPEERARLDRLRRGELPEPAEGTAREQRTPAVTGYVRRSDGRNTVWVDGTPVATKKDPRTFDPKVVLPRPEPPKAPGAQGADAKGAEAKAADAKGADTKGADTKASGTKADPAGTTKPPPGPARPEPAKR